MVKRITAYTGIVLMTVLLAACGSSQNPSSPAPTDTPAAPASAIGPADTAAPAAGTVNVAISGFAFDPATITIKAGQSVTWTNKDGVVHTVTADDHSWTSGDIANGQTFTQTFSTAGTYKYFCAVHPNMVGTVVVQ
jgi:plastocyanin